MRVLLACEESQTVCKAYRKYGHEAYSCDLVACSGDHPEWHLRCDVSTILDDRWDMVIAFPPCTHLSSSGNRWRKGKQKLGFEQKAIDFFLKFTKLKCPWAIENPVGVMASHYRKPDQIVQPWMFGDSFTKTTCLWLNRLPKLVGTNFVDTGNFSATASGKVLPTWYSNASIIDRGKLRSKTFDGLAEAMATQWGTKVLLPGGNYYVAANLHNVSHR